MKKKIIVIFILILVVVISIALIIKIYHVKQEKNENDIYEDNEKDTYINERLKELGLNPDDEKMFQVFLKTHVSENKVREIQKEILKIDNVESTKIITKDEALETMKEKLDNEELLKDYEGDNNIFPDSIVVKVIDISKIEETIKLIEKMEDVDKIISSDKTIDAIKKIVEKEYYDNKNENTYIKNIY